jgi:hypothetical protein
MTTAFQKFTYSINGLLLLGILTLLFSGCYYDNEEELYPVKAGGGGAICDTLNVTYSGKIAAIMQQSCTNCHGGSSPSAGIDLSSYAAIKPYVLDGSLYSSIVQDGSNVGMPKNEAKLDTCTIKKVKIWIDAGSPNN